MRRETEIEGEGEREERRARERRENERIKYVVIKNGKLHHRHQFMLTAILTE